MSQQQIPIIYYEYFPKQMQSIFVLYHTKIGCIVQEQYHYPGHYDLHHQHPNPCFQQKLLLYTLHQLCFYKLIRWRFVVHGSIDGYSRLITYLKCSPSNKASTVYDSFDGVPKHVRSDHGRENVHLHVEVHVKSPWRRDFCNCGQLNTQ